MRINIVFGILLLLSGCAASAFHNYELGANSSIQKIGVIGKFVIEIETPKEGVNVGVRVSEDYHIESGRDHVWIFNEAYGAPRMGMTFSDTRLRIKLVRKENFAEVHKGSLSNFITLLQNEYAKKHVEYSLELEEKKLGKYKFALRDDNLNEYQTVNSYFLL